MNLPDSLLECARRRAEDDGRTVTSLMEEALRDLLDRVRNEPSPGSLPVWSGGGTVLVDIDDREALWDALDAEGVR